MRERRDKFKCVMVEVFKTNIRKKKEANFILQRLRLMFPNDKINFDLEDCDNILRIETEDSMINFQDVIHIVDSYGFKVEVLAGEIFM